MCQHLRRSSGGINIRADARNMTGDVRVMQAGFSVDFLFFPFSHIDLTIYPHDTL